MRPEDLKALFTREEQRVAIHDRVWYVPGRHSKTDPFIFPGWDHADFFGNNNPVCVEYCSGNGTWIAEKAIAHPEWNWVAVEKKYLRVRKIWAKIKNYNLDNLIVVCGEAHLATHRFFPANSIQDVYINFPDPWPKHRHIKHRLIQDAFVKELWRILKRERSLTFVTDDPPYSEWLIEVMKKCSGFSSLYADPFYITEYPGYGSSYFEELWRSKGLEIRYHQFQKMRDFHDE